VRFNQHNKRTRAFSVRLCVIPEAKESGEDIFIERAASEPTPPDQLIDTMMTKEQDQKIKPNDAWG